MFSNIPGLFLPEKPVTNTPHFHLSRCGKVEIVQCLLGGISPLVENHWLTSISCMPGANAFWWMIRISVCWSKHDCCLTCLKEGSWNNGDTLYSFFYPVENLSVHDWRCCCFFRGPRSFVTASCTEGAWCIRAGLSLLSCRSSISHSYNKYTDYLKKKLLKGQSLYNRRDVSIFCFGFRYLILFKISGSVLRFYYTQRLTICNSLPRPSS